jgi:hypothetical protein
MDPRERATSVWYRIAGLISRRQQDLAVDIIEVQIRSGHASFVLDLKPTARDRAVKLGFVHILSREWRQELLQALLQIADQGVFVLRRLAGHREPGFDLSLCGLPTPTHQPLLACHSRYHCAGTDDRIGEGVRVG